MSTQKQLIDTGTPGDETSGETINAGGVKINTNTNSIWSTFADDSGNLISTLPFVRGFDYNNNLEPNRQYDIDTSGGSLIVRLAPSSENAYKTGDVIVLRDARGTWYDANVALVIRDDDGDISGQTQISLQNSFTEVRLVCISGPENKWLHSITSLTQKSYKAVDIIKSVTPTSPLNEIIYRADTFHCMKLLITASSNVDPNDKTVSEVLVTDDGTNACHTEYAVLNTTDENEPVMSIDFSMTNDEIFIQVGATAGYPSCTVQVTEIEKIEKVN